MRLPLISLAILSFVSADPALADTLDSKAAANHIGESHKVCGFVAQVAHQRLFTALNMGAPYPNQHFYGLIWNRDLRFMGNVDAYQGERICISGIIEQYKGRAQIVVRHSEQISKR